MRQADVLQKAGVSPYDPDNHYMSTGAAILVLSSLLIIGGGLALFLWAFFNGQFDHIKKGSMLPFDDEEPAGRRTDQIFADDKSDKIEGSRAGGGMKKGDREESGIKSDRSKKNE